MKKIIFGLFVFMLAGVASAGEITIYDFINKAIKEAKYQPLWEKASKDYYSSVKISDSNKQWQVKNDDELEIFINGLDDFLTAKNIIPIYVELYGWDRKALVAPISDFPEK